MSTYELTIEQVIHQCGDTTTCECKQFPSVIWRNEIEENKTSINYWDWVLQQANLNKIDISTLNGE